MTREKRPFVAFGFASVHDALDAEATLARAGVPALAIPSPRELGELCGIALRVEPGQAAAARSALADAGTSPIAEADIVDL